MVKAGRPVLWSDVNRRQLEGLGLRRDQVEFVLSVDIGSCAMVPMLVARPGDRRLRLDAAQRPAALRRPRHRAGRGSWPGGPRVAVENARLYREAPGRPTG